MPKRKPARPAKRATATRPGGSTGRSAKGRTAARKTQTTAKRRPSAARASGSAARKAASSASAKSAASGARGAASRKANASTRRTGTSGARKAGPRRTTKPLGPPPAPGKGSLTKGTPLDRARFALEETVQTPPSSLDMPRRGSAARTGRAEIEEHLSEHSTMTPDIAAGDPDVDIEDAYFTGEEAPGGDNPTPDQDIVDDIGKALGVQYEDDEELKGADKVADRDRKRWELDPASSEDYKDRR